MLKKISFILSLIIAVQASAGIMVYEPSTVTSKSKIVENDTYFVISQNRYFNLDNGYEIDVEKVLKNLQPVAELSQVTSNLKEEQLEEFNKAVFEAFKQEFNMSTYYLQDKAWGNITVFFVNASNIYVLKPEYRYEEVTKDIVFKGNVFYTYKFTKPQERFKDKKFKYTAEEYTSSNGVKSLEFKIEETY